jgi:formamidopyrimidine-DNA glycosylase
MSIELSEARILALQMEKEIKGKRIKSCQLKDYERLQKIGMLDKDLKSFDQLSNGKIESIISRGNVIHVKLNNGMNLILGPEYGGKIFYHENKGKVPSKFHLRVDFSDDTALTIRLTSIGHFSALKDKDLEKNYIYRRDFNTQVLSPLEDEFTFPSFSKLLADNNRMLKSVLVGKSAILVGLSNSAFQDILYRGKLHPKRKASELNEKEQYALYDSITLLLQERIKLNGKDQFHDLYGTPGGYTPTMGPNLKEQTCPECNTPIEKLSIGGGHVYLCPKCQQ